MAQVYDNADEIVAHLEGVTAAVVELGAGPVLRRARALLAQHTGDGAPDGQHHEIQLRLGFQTDAYVDLVGPAAQALEEGHFGRDGAYVDGIHVLRRAIGR